MSETEEPTGAGERLRWYAGYVLLWLGNWIFVRWGARLVGRGVVVWPLDDGDLTLGQITGGVAVLLDAPVGQVRQSVLPAVRDLLIDGQLTLPER